MSEACDLLGVPQGNMKVAPTGRNLGAIIVGKGTQAFVFKFYGVRNLGGLRRFIREVSFLRWGSSVALGSIPELLHVSYKNRWIATEMLVGQKPERVEDSHMGVAGDFVVRLAANPLGFSQRALPAQERLVSPGRLATQLKIKWRGIQVALAETEGATNILGTLEAVLGDYRERHVRLDLIDLGLFLDRLATRWKKTVIYSPSDFGLHNCLESRSGETLTLSLFDFEFAGADHPLKLIIDFLLQPDYPLTERHQDLFLKELKSQFPLDLEDIPASIWRLFIAKWILIVAKAEAKNLLFGRKSNDLSPGHLNQYSARFGGFFG